MATASVASARRVPAISSPRPEKAIVPMIMTSTAEPIPPAGDQPRMSPAITMITAWRTSTVTTVSVLAVRSPDRPSGVVPSRLRTP